jgi:phosphatidate cytidylyltransferase
MVELRRRGGGARDDSSRAVPDVRPVRRQNSGSPRTRRANGAFSNNGSVKLEVDSKGKWRSLRTRALSAAFMIAGLVGCLLGGHVPTIALIFVVQGAMVRELFALAVETRKEKDLPWFRLQQWYFYGCAVFFSYGRYLNARLAARFGEEYADEDASGRRNAVKATFESVLLKLLAHHGLISYLGWTLGCVLFVLSLRKGLYLYQFGQFGWTHMIIAAVIVQSSCLVGNVLEGLIWFVFPVGIVFFNDVAAYLVGMICGRTPLIKLSPKKTWEGFLGGAAVTMTVAPFAAAWLQRFRWLTCPSASALSFTGGPDLGKAALDACEADGVFAPRAVDLSIVASSVDAAFGWTLPSGFVERFTTIAGSFFFFDFGSNEGIVFHMSPFQKHAVVLAAFASVIAPFGGFFASGFKRAFKIKDFSDTIPGHGGITDRMDCQMVMAVFSHLYITNFVRRADGGLSLGALLLHVELLTNDELVKLYKAIGRALVARGLR